jgi:hypothetical protein
MYKNRGPECDEENGVSQLLVAKSNVSSCRVGQVSRREKDWSSSDLFAVTKCRQRSPQELCLAAKLSVSV